MALRELASDRLSVRSMMVSTRPGADQPVPEMAFEYRRYRGFWLLFGSQPLRRRRSSSTMPCSWSMLVMFSPLPLTPDILLQDLAFRAQMPRYSMSLDHDEGAEPECVNSPAAPKACGSSQKPTEQDASAWSSPQRLRPMPSSMWWATVPVNTPGGPHAEDMSCHTEPLGQPPVA